MRRALGTSTTETSQISIFNDEKQFARFAHVFSFVYISQPFSNDLFCDYLDGVGTWGQVIVNTKPIQYLDS